MSANVIRNVTCQELDACAAVIRKAFSTVAAEFGLTFQSCPTNGAYITAQRLRCERQNGVLQYGLYREGRLAGFVALERKDNAVYVLEKLSVLPKYRHRGCGTALLDFAKIMVSQLGGGRITIGIIEQNVVLKCWYQAQGFVSTGTATFPHLPFTVEFLEYRIP